MGGRDVTKFLKTFFNCKRGITALEYGMLAALIAVVLLAVLGSLGGDLKTTFDDIQTDLAKAANE
jgi:pilus assembly protein Flp/PilA